MVKNMKQRGFTLIELMVIMAIISILLSIVFAANFEQKNNKEGSITSLKISIPTDHIAIDKRSNRLAILQKHSDGSLWACVADGSCYEISQ